MKTTKKNLTLLLTKCFILEINLHQTEIACEKKTTKEPIIRDCFDEIDEFI